MVRRANKYSICRKVEGKAAGQDLDGLKRDGNTASVSRVHNKTIMEVTPVKNGSTKCVTKFRRKTQMSNRSGRAASRFSLNTTPLPGDGAAGQQFHATVSMTSSENDIDILNTASSGS